jgi:hypothetical protein
LCGPDTETPARENPNWLLSEALSDGILLAQLTALVIAFLELTMNVALLAFVKTFGLGWEMHFGPASADYVHAVLTHWGAILVGVAVLFVDAIKWHGKEVKTPTWLKVTVAVSVFSAAQFLAYRDAMLNFERTRQEKAAAMGESETLKIEVAPQQARLEEKGQPDSVAAALD